MPFSLPPVFIRACKFLLLTLVACIFVVGVGLGVVWQLGFRQAPIPIERPAVSKDSLVNQLAHGRWLQRTLQGESLRLDLPLPQLNALAFDLTKQTVGGRVAFHLVGKQQVAVDVSVPTDRTPLKRYLPDAWINVQTLWAIGDKGKFQLHRLQWGELTVPVSMASWIFDRAMSRQALTPFLNVGLETIQQIRLKPDLIQVDWQWRDDLRARTFAALIPATEFSRLKQHHEALCLAIDTALPVAKETGGYMPIIHVLKPMFLRAQQRTLAQQLNPDRVVPSGLLPAYENRAALLVMTLHAMQIHPSELMPQAKDWPIALPYPLTLHGRVDFAQHYLLSALLASGVGGRIADLIGLYKERIDKIAGSGFSFNDVAADRAGIKFGQRAQLMPQHLQERVQQGEDEDFFMPDVEDMPQYLSAKEFDSRFAGQNKNAYEALLAQIDQRIARLGVLQ